MNEIGYEEHEDILNLDGLAWIHRLLEEYDYVSRSFHGNSNLAKGLRLGCIIEIMGLLRLHPEKRVEFVYNLLSEFPEIQLLLKEKTDKKVFPQ